MIDVLKAAEFLDSKVGTVSWLTADWRSKIDTNKLDMSSMRSCILGQLKGHYDDAHTDLKLESQDMDIRDSFCSGTIAWVSYLKENNHMYTVGTTLWGIHNEMKYTILATYTKDGVRYYVISVEGSTHKGDIWSEDKIKADWTTVEPKRYKEGDILALQGQAKGSYVIVGKDDHGQRIGSSDKHYTYTGWGRMENYIKNGFTVVGDIGDGEWHTGLKIVK